MKAASAATIGVTKRPTMRKLTHSVRALATATKQYTRTVGPYRDGSFRSLENALLMLIGPRWARQNPAHQVAYAECLVGYPQHLAFVTDLGLDLRHLALSP